MFVLSTLFEFGCLTSIPLTIAAIQELSQTCIESSLRWICHDEWFTCNEIIDIVVKWWRQINNTSSTTWKRKQNEN